MRRVFLFIASLFCLLAHADWEQESQKIEFLLKSVESSQATFIRNGSEYPSKKAVAHLRMKLKAAQSSWFSPDKEKWTAKMFIEKIASKSSFSGKAYQIKLKSGEVKKSGDWLREKLKEYPLKKK